MRALIFFFLSLFLFTGNAQATLKDMVLIGSEREQALGEVEAYLNNLITIVADFSQVAPDGSLTGGKFFLKRPGKMRWQYDPPTPILMTTTGQFLTYYDYQLEQVSKIPIESTLAGFIAKEHITFRDKAVAVDRVEKEPGILRVALHQADKPKDGSLLLEFSDAPIALRNMVVTDAQGQTTQIGLNNARFDQPLDDEMFVFKDPRKKRRN